MSWNNVVPAWVLEAWPEPKKETMYNTKLSKAEAERLNLLAEEAAEVIQAVMKIQRHGYDSTNPLNPAHRGNKDDLMREIGDLLAVLAYMEVAGDLVVNDGEHEFDPVSITTYSRLKFESLTRRDYLHFQKDILDTAEANSR